MPKTARTRYLLPTLQTGRNDNAVFLLCGLQQTRDIFRPVLAVTVQSDDGINPECQRMLHAGP